MDETRKADEIRRLLEAAEASEKPWDWEYGLEQARLDIHYLLAALDAAEQKVEKLKANLEAIDANAGVDVAIARGDRWQQRAAEAEELLRIIASYDYSLDCPYCTIRNDGVHEPGCEYQAIVKYLEGVEVAGRARSAQTRIDDI